MMKKRLLRSTAFALTLGLALQVGVSAAKYPYVYPDDWSRNALVFAVENGIFQGNTNHDLEPKRSTTRAEMAAVLVRLLELDGKADLSSYQDVSTTAWYVRELSAAVAGGIFNGMSATSMAPNGSITREQTMTVLCRAFGLAAWDPQAYGSYSDGASVSNYAKDAVSAMQERDLVHGYGDGTLKPKNSITRAEVAQLVYNLFDAIVDDPKEMPDSGRVLYVGSKPLPNELVLNGSLILGASYDGPIGKWTVTDDLVLRCPGKSFDLSGVTAKSITCTTTGASLTGTPNADRLVLWGENLRANCPVAQLVVMGGSAQINSAVEQISVRGGHAQIGGTVGTLTVTGGDTVLNSTVGDAYLTGGSLMLNGTAKIVTISGENCKLSGIGHVGEIIQSCQNASITVSYDKLTGSKRNGLQGVSLSLSAPDAVTKEGQQVTLTATCKGGSFTGPDCVGGKLICTLQWLHGGKVVAEDKQFPVCDGATASHTFTFQANSAKDIKVRLVNGSETLEASRTVDLQFHSKELNTVRTAKVEAWAHTDTYLYADQAGTKRLRALPKNTVVYVEFNALDGMIKVSAKDGTIGWVYDSKVWVSSEQFTDSSVDFSTAAKENYINQAGYSSDTQYLLWISRYTQRVNVFQGSKGKWKLIKTFLVSTGGNETPTPAGSYRTYYHENQWTWSSYYVNTITGFYNGHAFHTILKSPNGGYYDSRVGIPLSHGCIRMQEADCNYIYNLPLYTRVVVY